MDFNYLFDKIELWDMGREQFFDIHKRAENKRFSDNVKMAYLKFRRGDDVFAPFLEKFAEEEGLLPDVLNLYLFFRFTEPLYAEYKSRGYDDSVYYDSVRALAATGRTHFIRCDVCGVRQPGGRNWFRRLFSLGIFRFGRLEFEIIPAPFDAEINGESIKKGELCVTTHIPGFAKLDEELCENAYSAAREFFGKHFGIKKLFFFCDSWLLHPWLKEVLGESSGIIKFQNKYRVYTSVIDHDDVIEHVFTRFRDSVDEYPEDTSLQRIVKERLKSGAPMGTAVGVRL